MKSMYEPIEWLEKARLDFYEQTKDMTSQEITAMIRKDVQEIEKKYGLKFRRAQLPLQHNIHEEHA